MKSVQLKSVPTRVSDIPLQDASMDIWDKKYRLKRKDGVPVDAAIDVDILSPALECIRSKPTHDRSRLD